jgi:hypothetical protein
VALWWWWWWWWCGWRCSDGVVVGDVREWRSGGVERMVVLLWYERRVFIPGDQEINQSPQSYQQ